MPLPTKKSEKEINYLKKIYLIYGTPKIGKTTIASRFGDEENKVLFFPTEAGHKEQSIYKWHTIEKISVEGKPNESKLIERDPTNWEHFRTCVHEMTQQEAFKHLVVDTVDNLFTWCQAHVRQREGIKHEKDLDFGAGYDLVKTEFAKPINYLTQKGYGVSFLSHEKESNVEDDGRKYKEIRTTLPNTARKVVEPMCDYIFYFHLNKQGERVILTKGSEKIVAGDRSGLLPAEIPMDAEALIKALSVREVPLEN